MRRLPTTVVSYSRYDDMDTLMINRWLIIIMQQNDEVWYDSGMHRVIIDGDWVTVYMDYRDHSVKIEFVGDIVMHINIENILR